MSHSGAEAWLVHQRAARALGRLQRLAPREPFLVVKSVALAARYGWDAAELPVADVDVRMPPEAYAALRRRVVDAGDVPVLDDNRLYGNLVLELEGHLVDIESSCGPPFFTRLSVNHLLRRAELAELPGIEPFLVPDTTDHALLLAINLFKDGLGQEIAANARSNALRIVAEKEFDVDAFVRRARWAYLHTACALVARELAPRSAVWRSLEDELGPPPRRWYARLHDATRGQPSAIVARLVRRAGTDHWLHRGAALGSAALLVGSDALRRRPP